ncbi:MAG TPA: hypothetical protein PKY29_04205 [Ferruginibacter sp.]|nr:hypothetical protein [Ferruginibacter sp.]HRN79905.1 hypothetical protein [Ferruginibacter sp.]HRO18207.1 hypothetical protein [Ferruginibacter sp.]HRQ20490.1 hypothetical protein [Ferruginibacter sp.]
MSFKVVFHCLLCSSLLNLLLFLQAVKAQNPWEETDRLLAGHAGIALKSAGD